jgi:preprotein translocase subunit SecA
MISNVLKKIFGSRNDRLIKTYQKTVNVINHFEEKLTTLSDEDLKAKTSEFKEALAAGKVLG